MSGGERRRSGSWSARGEEEKEVAGRGARRGAGREEDGTRVSRAAAALQVLSVRAEVRSPRTRRCAAGQRAGTGAVGDRHSGEPGAPGGARRARGPAARGSTPACGCTGPWETPACGESAPARESRSYFVCWIRSCGEAFVSPPLNICSCVTCCVWGWGGRRCV